ncbi:MAG TPA: hypothetical protein VGS21_05760 [Acidimicrobiales bacterium]|nr:hypothetical protein [Acidimicrobiales bacterium]
MTPNDQVTALLRRAADEAEAHYRPIDVAALVQASPSRALVAFPVRRLVAAAFVGLALLAGLIAILRSDHHGRGLEPPARGGPPSLAALEREYPKPVAEALAWIESRVTGVVAGPTWLPIPPDETYTPYVSSRAGSLDLGRSTYFVWLVPGGSGAVTVGPPPRRTPVLISFSVTTWSSAGSALAAVLKVAVRPPGPSSSVQIGDGVVGYLHHAGPTGQSIFFLDGAWQFKTGGPTQSSAVTAARGVVAFLSRLGAPSSSGYLSVDAGSTCVAASQLGSATLTVDINGIAEATCGVAAVHSTLSARSVR